MPSRQPLLDVPKEVVPHQHPQSLSAHSGSSRLSPNAVGSSSTISALRFQQRKGQTKRSGIVPPKDENTVVGYSTANQYNLLSIREHLAKQGLYQTEELVEELTPLCVYAKARYQVEGESQEQVRDMFFFENGSCIFWNTPALERDNILAFLKPFETESYSEDTVHEESEMIDYKLTPTETRLGNGVIHLGTSSPEPRLEKYAFSNAIAASVKLGALEKGLDRIIDSTEHISEDLKKGLKLSMTRKEVLQKTGEIFALRHVLSLSSDLMDTPDFYWDRESLEKLYHSTCGHLSIGKRARVMNEKLTHCAELMDLITTHLNDEHHVRLEWFIIVLIMIEVVFELAHFVERYL